MVVDPELAKANALLKQFQVDGLNNVYQLGCTATPQNVFAQQQRAFNLIWALNKIRPNLNGQKIAIVGGGIAGLTATAGFLSLGAGVHLFERMLDILHLQQGNLTRFLHPNIALWPADGFGYPVTHMPFMNWRAGCAGDVESQLRRQWKRMLSYGSLPGRLTQQFDCKVTSLRRSNFKTIVNYKQSAQRKRQSFDIVIIASGYGVESPTLSNTPSYWRNDDFAQMVLGRKNKIRYLVSGTGDGGLIDTLRLTIVDFQHQKFFQSVMYDASLRKFGNQIREWLKAGSPSNVWTGIIDNTTILDTDVTASLDRIFDDPFIRSDTKVTLNSRKPNPFDTEAQLFHKIAVAALLRKAKLTHVAGDLKNAYIDKNNKEVVALISPSSGANDQYERADFLIQRHNAAATLPAILATQGRQGMNLPREKSKQDVTNLPLYGLGFLADQFMSSHYESAYEVGFRVAQPALLAKQILENLGMSQQSGACTSPGYTLPASYVWKNNKSFTFKEECHYFHIDANNLRGYPCVVLETESREILEASLHPKLQYHFLRLRPTRTDFDTDPAVVDTHTGVWLMTYYNRQLFEVQILKHDFPARGMYNAHRLLRLPTLLEILYTRWTTTKVFGIGWATWVLPPQKLFEDERGNTLLQWDNHLAWWQPLEIEERL